METNRNSPCHGCAYYADFPSHIKCQGCARAYSDHYEEQSTDKIVMFRVAFTQYSVRNGKRYDISGGYFNVKFNYSKCKLQNLYRIEFPTTELSEKTFLELRIINPIDGLVMCRSNHSLSPNIVAVYVRKGSWTIDIPNDSTEYIKEALSKNSANSF